MKHVTRSLSIIALAVFTAGITPASNSDADANQGSDHAQSIGKQETDGGSARGPFGGVGGMGDGCDTSGAEDCGFHPAAGAGGWRDDQAYGGVTETDTD